MAKVKTAKQRITDFLRAKGWDAHEIRDAFDELDAADVDLEKAQADLGLVTQKNTEWNTWWEGVKPQVQAAISERDSLQQQIRALEAAGVKITPTATTATPAEPGAGKTAQGGYITAEDFESFKRNLMQGTSGVMKGLSKVTMKHLKEFNEEPDLDAIEKLVSEKGYSVEDAYENWARPKYEEKKSKWMETEIERRAKEMTQAELSKSGISRSRKRTDDVEPAPLDKPAPTDRDLRDAFINDLNTAVTN